MYVRENQKVVFLLPTLAIGVDTDGRYFFEAAWLHWAIGVGSLDS